MQEFRSLMVLAGVVSTLATGSAAAQRIPATPNNPLVQLAELTASGGQSNDQLGYSVAISGNTVVAAAVGVNGYQGAVYVYLKPASGWGNMTQTAELTASDGVPGDNFGESVAISGNTVVVGAGHAAVGGDIEQGAIYVFVEPADGWGNMTETAKLTASDGAAQDLLGASVATNGNTIAAGAVGWNTSEGEAYVFVEPAGGWKSTSSFAGTLTASHGRSPDAFGSAVSIGSNTIVVGASQAGGQRGTVCVFVKPANGWKSMTQTASLNQSETGLGGSMGVSVSISSDGTTVAAGASTEQKDEIPTGAVFVFVEPSGGWKNMTQTAKLTASDGADYDELGLSVSISGNAILAGAPQLTGTGPGRAYLFSEPAGGWRNMTQTTELTATGGQNGDDFGLAVDLNGNTAVMGAPGATVKGNQYQGSAYVFGP
jgi:hypothetical protein